jgi:hypothetical protein
VEERPPPLPLPAPPIGQSARRRRPAGGPGGAVRSDRKGPAVLRPRGGPGCSFLPPYLLFSLNSPPLRWAMDPWMPGLSSVWEEKALLDGRTVILALEKKVQGPEIGKWVLFSSRSESKVCGSYFIFLLAPISGGKSAHVAAGKPTGHQGRMHPVVDRRICQNLEDEKKNCIHCFSTNHKKAIGNNHESASCKTKYGKKKKSYHVRNTHKTNC